MHLYFYLSKILNLIFVLFWHKWCRNIHAYFFFKLIIYIGNGSKLMTNIIIDSIAYYVPELCDVFSILEHQMSLHYYV